MTAFYDYLLSTGTTQTWVAQQVGVAKTAVNKWTMGGRISLENKTKLRRVLKDRALVDVDAMVDAMPHRDSFNTGTPFDRMTGRAA